MSGIGAQFQEQTKYWPDKMSGNGLDWAGQPETYKEYNQCPQIDLPPYEQRQDLSLNQVLSQRRSIRDFQDQPLPLEDLSYLLWAADGITRRQWGYEFRAAPSAGALYPVETYLIVNNVSQLEKGLYHYSVKKHLLEQLNLGDLRVAIAEAALGQTICAAAAVVFVWTAVFGRSIWKYKQRAYRYVYLDAVHIGQNLALAATNLALGSCQIAALFDDQVNKILQIDGVEESVIYMSVVGRPAAGA